MPGMTIDDLRKSLTNQPPKNEAVIGTIEEFRVHAREMGEAIFALCPESRERSLAITHLEDATMWAVKAIIIHQDD